MTSDLLVILQSGQPLSASTARAFFDRLVAGSTSDDDRVTLLRAVSARPESTADLVALAREMRRRATAFPLPAGTRAIDLCGSGGARRPSFNVSTVSAFVVAAAGVPVVKHGNRSARGPCGSSDLLEALGLPVTQSPHFARATFDHHQIAFLHAPLFHPATRSVVRARQLIGTPTVFNRLGPLVHPSPVHRHLAGAVDRPAARRMGEALARLGVREGVAVTSEDGADEFSPNRPSEVFAWHGNGGRWSQVDPSRLLDPEDQRGPWGPLSPPEAASETGRILAGGGGARRGSILLTSGAALRLAGRARTLRAGIDLAREALDTGSAEELLRSLQELAGSRDWSTEGERWAS